MYKLITLILLLGLQVSCKSDSNEDCPEWNYFHTQYNDLLQYIPRYIYATENTNEACYAHGLEVIERRNSYTPDYETDRCSVAATLDSTVYYQEYKMDTIEEKFTDDFENLNAAEVEELTNLVCGREFGNESFEIQSLESFEVNNGQLIVEFMVGDTFQTRTISSYIDSGFNCPLYSFSCSDQIID